MAHGTHISSENTGPLIDTPTIIAPSDSQFPDTDKTLAYYVDTDPTLMTQPLPDTGIHLTLPTQKDDKEDDEDDDKIVVLPFIPPVEATPAASVPVVQGTPPASIPMVQGAPLASTSSYSAVVLPNLPTTPAAPLLLTSAAVVPIISVLVAAVVIIALGAAFLIPASLSITGVKDNAVPSGSVMHLHGDHFIWGGTVSLTLDNNVRLATIAQTPNNVNATAGAAQTPTNSAQATATAGAAQTPLASTTLQKSSTSTFSPIPVGFFGTFDANILVNVNWTLGKHVIHAKEQFASRHADITFTVTPSLASLIVSPSFLNFGQLQAGQQVTQAIVVSNGGDDPLQWQAQTPTSSPGWLSVPATSGTLLGPTAQENINVTVDTRGMSLGTYTTTFSVLSNAQNMQITVTMQIVKTAIGPKVCAGTRSASLGTLPNGPLSYFQINLWNCGTQTLQWKVQSSLPWLSVTPNLGTLPVSGPPQIVQLTINPAKLKNGTYTLTMTYTAQKLPKGGYAVIISIAATVNGARADATSAGRGGYLAVFSPMVDDTPLLSFTFAVSTAQPPSPPVPPALLNTPLAFSVPGDKNCTYAANKGWTCTVTLSTYQSAQTTLPWTATSNGIQGATFSPASGTLTAGQAAKVTIAIPNVACPHAATFSFAGPANIVNIQWNCGPIPMTASTTNINGNTDCVFSNGWTCHLILSTDKQAQGEAQWSLASKGITRITATPANGLLTPGQMQDVTLKIPNTACPASAAFSVADQGANTVNIAWKCSEPSIVMSSTGINGNTDCTFNNGWTCTDTLTLDSNLPGNPTVAWTTTANNINGITFSPASGQIGYKEGGQATTISIFIPGVTCPASATLSFAAQRSNSVGVTWGCTEPKIVISQESINGNTDCTYNKGWTCAVGLALASKNPGDPSVGWSVSGSGINGIAFSPANGTLSTGQNVTVTINIPPTGCPAGAKFAFASPANTVTVGWGCVEPQIGISAGNIDGNTDCTYNNGWTCTEDLALTTDNKGDPSVNWSAGGNGINGIAFSPANGTLAAGQKITVTITVPPTNCPATASFVFAGQSTNTVTVPWKCEAPPLKVDVDQFHANTDCNYNNGWTCTEKLSVGSNNPGDPPVNWSASSNGIDGVGFSPDHGTLGPGQSADITVTVPHVDCGAHTDLVFSGGADPVKTGWDCSPAHIHVGVDRYNIPDNNCTYSSGSGWNCVETLSVKNQGDPPTNWSASANLNGVSFSPATGTVGPGQPANVTIHVPDVVCPQSTNFVFSGPDNNVTVSWSCAAPTLVDTSGGGSCPFDRQGHFVCTDVIGLASGSQGDVVWQAANVSIGVPISFNPPQGTLAPGQQQSVTVTITATTCAATIGKYAYAAQGSNTITITVVCPGSSIGGGSHGGISLNTATYSVSPWVERKRSLLAS